MIRPFIARHYRTFLIVAILLLGLWLYRGPIFQWIRLFSDRETILAFLRGYGIWGPAMVAVLLLVQLFIAFIPGHLLVAASGYVYGAPVTIVVVSITGILGSQLAFLLARNYGRPLIHRLVSERSLEKWNRIAGDRGPLFYFFMFVMPFVPSDLMCYVAGLGKISARNFFIANFMGRLWSTTETSILGAYGFQPPPVFWVIFLISMAVLYLAWLIYKKSSPSHVEKP